MQGVGIQTGLGFRPWAWVLALWCTAGLVLMASAASAAESVGAARRATRSEVPKPEAPKVDMSIRWMPYVRPPLQPGSLQSGALAAPGEASARLARDAAVHGPRLWTMAVEDRRLSMVLQRWSAQAGWQLVWEAERDFPIEAHVQIHAGFLEALEEVMSSLSDSDYPLQAVMNAQTGVLRVRRQHESLR